MAQDSENSVYTLDQLEAEANALAQSSSLHTTGREAWRQVQAGALEGTLLASRLAQIYFLIDHYEPTPCAAE